MILEISLDELCTRLRQPYEAENLNHLNGVDAILVGEPHCDTSAARHPQCPVLCLTEASNPHELIDLVVTSKDDLDVAMDGIQNSPTASQLLTQLLRHNEKSSIAEALFAESLTYSTLQHGEQFRSWLAQHKRREQTTEFSESAILVSRERAELRLTLNRPEKRNAWSVEMRDALTESLQLLDADASIETVTINANGPAFGAGGDLDEFGLARDAALAHLTRSIRNPGLLLDEHREKVTVHLHGACVGAGIEIPAFASRITAKPDTFCLLPEVAFGLIPGAGGTASILRRIGRQRLAWMAIGGQRIDAQTACEWGLIDAIVD